MSVAYIGPKSRTGRLKLAQVAHATRDSDIIFKVKTSKVKVTGGGGILWRPSAYSLLQYHICTNALLTSRNFGDGDINISVSSIPYFVGDLSPSRGIDAPWVHFLLPIYLFELGLSVSLSDRLSPCVLIQVHKSRTKDRGNLKCC